MEYYYNIGKVYKIGKKRGAASDDSGGRVVRTLVHGSKGSRCVKLIMNTVYITENSALLLQNFSELSPFPLHFAPVL